MTDKRRIQIEDATDGLFSSENAALCGSIQNFRKIMEKKEGREVSFQEALNEWKERIYTPLISEIKNDAVINLALGHSRYAAFFPSLYLIEDRGFEFDSAIARMVALRMSTGLRSHISKIASRAV